MFSFNSCTRFDIHIRAYFSNEFFFQKCLLHRCFWGRLPDFYLYGTLIFVALWYPSVVSLLHSSFPWSQQTIFRRFKWKHGMRIWLWSQTSTILLEKKWACLTTLCQTHAKMSKIPKHTIYFVDRFHGDLKQTSQWSQYPQPVNHSTHSSCWYQSSCFLRCFSFPDISSQ